VEAPKGNGLGGLVTAVVQPLPAPQGGVPSNVLTLAGPGSHQTPLWRSQPGFANEVAAPGSPMPGGLASLSHHQPHFGALPASSSSAAMAGGRVTFDWRQVQLRQDQGDWKLMAGGLVLGNFGGNGEDARQALSIIRYYRFCELWHMSDQPSTCYYLANVQAPRGLMFGLQGESFVPDQVTLQQTGDSYDLVEGKRVLLHAGEQQEQAKKLLEAIKNSKCDRLCKLGEAGKEARMTFLVRSH
jgi:hypothetical protein